MACPICAAAGQVPAAEVDGRRLLICRDCRHTTWAAMPTEADLSAFYSSTYTGSHGQTALQASHTAYYRGHAKELASLVRQPLAEMAVADIGCSIPVFLEQAAALGCGKSIGVDWSEEAREYGAERGVRVVTPDAFLAEVPDASLDVLRYSHVLEHLTDPLAVLRSQVRKLKPGGLLYITQPNLPMLRADQVPAPHDNTYPTHLHFFTSASLVRLVEAVGCGVERFYTVATPEQHSASHGSAFDLDAAVACAALPGEAARGTLNNFPFYFGRNSTIYARAGAPPAEMPAPLAGDGVSRLLSARLAGAALAYAVNTGDTAMLRQAGCARIVAFGDVPAGPGVEQTGLAAGAEAGMRVIGYTRVADTFGKLRLMCRRVLGRPGTLREITFVTLDQFSQERGEAPGLIVIEGGGAPLVLAGAAGLLDQARPILMFVMVDADFALIRALLAGRYDVLRRADWSDALQARTGRSTPAEAVLALPRT